MKDILVVYSNVTSLYEQSVFDRYYSQVSGYRKGKVSRLSAMADRARSLGAGYISEQYKGDYTHSNISHSGDYCMVAFWDGMIGCDIERLGRVTQRVVERFFCESEAKWSDSHEKATQMWTYKESFIKAVEKGLSLSFKDFEIEPFGSMGADAEVRQEVVDKDFSLVSIEIDPGYKGAVCFEKGLSKPGIILKSYCLE